MSTEQLLKTRDEAEKKLAQVNAEIARVEALTKLYPDLKRHVGRWEKVVYGSASVNPLVDKYETRYNCGCCGDSPLELWPYLETEHGRVYSNPSSFFIGERDPFFGGAVSKSGWREQLRGYGISEAVIEKVSGMFDEEREKAKEAVEERYSEDGIGEDPEPLL